MALIQYKYDLSRYAMILYIFIMDDPYTDKMVSLHSLYWDGPWWRQVANHKLNNCYVNHGEFVFIN